MGDASWALSADLTQRVPGHALIEELLRQWDLATIRLDERGEVVIDDEARGWYLGVLGERRVALELLRLGPEWTVLHSVPVGSGSADIDHVVIGPGGVFTVNTKHSRGKAVWYAGLGMYVGGAGQRYVRNAVYEARRARTLLSNAVRAPVPVTGVIAFVDPSSITSKAPAGEGDVPILVVSDRDVAQAFRRRPVLTPDQVERIVTAAVIPGTWKSRPTPWTDGGKITEEFLALEEALGALEQPEPTPRIPSGVSAARRSRIPRTYGVPRTRVRRRRGKVSVLEEMVFGLLRLGVSLLVIWVAIQVAHGMLAQSIATP